MLGWIAADLAYQGLVEAGPDFDQAAVIDATNAIEGYTAGGLTPPVDWGRQHVAPTAADPTTNGPAQVCTTLVRIEGTGYELLGEPDAPWACWDAGEEAYGEPEFRDFD